MPSYETDEFSVDLAGLKVDELTTGSVTPKQFISSLSKCNISEFIILSIDILQEAVTCSQSVKEELPHIMRDYMNTNYDSALERLLDIFSNNTINETWQNSIHQAKVLLPEIRQRVITHTGPTTQNNNSRRFLESVLAQRYLHDIPREKHLKSLISLTEENGTSLSAGSLSNFIAVTMEEVMYKYSFYSEKAFGYFKERFLNETLQLSAMPRGRGEEVRNPRHLPASRNFGITTSTTPLPSTLSDSGTRHQEVSSVSDRIKISRGHSWASENARSPFVASYSGHTIGCIGQLFLIIDDLRKQKKLYGDNIQDFTHDFFEALISVYISQGWHSYFEITAILSDPVIVKDFKDEGIDLDVDVLFAKASHLRDSFSDAASYTAKLCATKTLLDDIKCPPIPLRSTQDGLEHAKKLYKEHYKKIRRKIPKKSFSKRINKVNSKMVEGRSIENKIAVLYDLLKRTRGNDTSTEELINLFKEIDKAIDEANESNDLDSAYTLNSIRIELGGDPYKSPFARACLLKNHFDEGMTGYTGEDYSELNSDYNTVNTDNPAQDQKLTQDGAVFLAYAAGPGATSSAQEKINSSIDEHSHDLSLNAMVSDAKQAKSIAETIDAQLSEEFAGLNGTEKVKLRDEILEYQRYKDENLRDHQGTDTTSNTNIISYANAILQREISRRIDSFNDLDSKQKQEVRICAQEEAKVGKEQRNLDDLLQRSENKVKTRHKHMIDQMVNNLCTQVENKRELFNNVITNVGRLTKCGAKQFLDEVKKSDIARKRSFHADSDNTKFIKAIDDVIRVVDGKTDADNIRSVDFAKVYYRGKNYSGKRKPSCLSECFGFSGDSRLSEARSSDNSVYGKSVDRSSLDQL